VQAVSRNNLIGGTHSALISWNKNQVQAVRVRLVIVPLSLEPTTSSKMVVPQLPHELWMEIIEYATYILGELDYRTYDPFHSPSARNLEQAIAQVLPTRYSFTLVSRFFHKVSLPILYQTLSITGSDRLWSIMRCLDANTTRSRMSPNVQEHALLVKRIHLAAYGEGRWPKSFAKPIPGTFEFSNLIIVGGNGNRLGSGEFDVFLQRDFLKRCSAACSIDGTWYTRANTHTHTHTHCRHFVQSYKNLRSLCSPVQVWPLDAPIPDSFKDSLSRVEALTVSCYWPFIKVPLTSLPSLCALRFGEFRIPNLRFVEPLGERVTFLDVAPPVNMQFNLDIFPNLRTLINRVGGWRSSKCIAHSPHSGLVRVAFSDQFIIPQRRKFKQGMIEFIDRSLFPQLKQIRLIDMRVCRRFVHQNPDHVKRWVNEGLDKGIRLEAGDGRLLSDLIR
jgi:hypothetical protein